MAWTEKQPMVSIRDIYKSFGNLEVLKGISLDVMKGEVICIIGPSGSGKSTLIRCVNGLNNIQKGSILVERQEVNDPKLDKLELRKKSWNGFPAIQFVSAQNRIAKYYDSTHQGAQTKQGRSRENGARLN